ncbi:uncharacterized protein LOC143534025 [Bidens hawaiensis]|uniref:uncharacterized protein LOC143534025 n=1 Tax=Bidens hawaiensis TaxID=980011 RepID=UPI00404A5FC6
MPSPPPPPSSSATLYKQKSWSPDLHREEEWTRRKGKHLLHRRRKSKSVTDEDIDELKACFDLGFGFDYDTISKSSSVSSSSAYSDPDLSSTSSSPHTIINRGDNPQTVKTRLRQWAQVVACSVRLSSSS